MSAPFELTSSDTSVQPLHSAIDRARRAWRTRVLLEGAVRVAIVAAVLLLLLSAIAIQWSPATVTMGRVRGAGWLVLAVAASWWLVRPAVRRIPTIRMVRYLEESEPAYGATLITAVETAASRGGMTSPLLARRVIDRATRLLDSEYRADRLERPRLRRAAMQCGALVLGIALLLTSGPPSWQRIARAMASPWLSIEQLIPPHSLTVEPGNLTIPRGSALDIHAVAAGFTPADALLLLRIAGTEEWQSQPMLTDSVGAFSLRLFDLDTSLTYRIEAGDASSDEFRITVTDLPTVRRVGTELDYPAYTGLPRDSFPDRGDVAAVRGTRVTVNPTLTLPIRSGLLRFDDGRTVSLVVADSMAPTAAFIMDSTGLYTIDLVAPDGTLVPGTVRWSVTVLDDRPTVVRIADPGRDTKATSVEEIPIAVSVDDDYGVSRIELLYSVNGSAEQAISLARRLAPATLTPRLVHTIFLEELTLTAGDLIAYHARATDGGGNVAESDIYFIEIRPFGRNYRQADEGGGGAAGEGGGEGGGGQQDLSRAQRELIVATYNIVRDSSLTDPQQFTEDLATLAGQQAERRAEVRELALQMVGRAAAKVDSNFKIIVAVLDSVVALQDSAVKLLRGARPRDALPPQQRALQQLQRAEAVYRDVELQLGGQASGGGGGGAAAGSQLPDDLADLFELDTDKLRNQYEAVQREGRSNTAAQATVDTARERLRALARRLEQENERMARARQQLEQRLGQSQAASGAAPATGAGGSPGSSAMGGSASARRQMAATAEAEARRLERLAREESNPQLAAAAQQARQAADALSRAAAGDEAQATNALESLREAARQIDAGQETAARDRAKGLAKRAEEVARAQQRLASDAVRAGGASGEERGRRAGELDGPARQLAEEVRDLTKQIQEAARAGRASDPAAARGLSEAANGLSEYQTAERIEYLPRLAADPRVDSASVARFNRDLQGALTAAATRLGEAAGAVGGSASRQQELSLERARELVRDLQSLRERGRQESLAQASREESQPIAGEPGQVGGGQPGSGRSGQPTGTEPANGRSNDGSGDTRQLQHEVRLRLGAAEELRGQLREQGIRLTELDDAIATLDRLTRADELADPVGRAQLQQDALLQVQQAEFQLWRRFGGGKGARPGSADLSRVPPRYRQMVEEYFRSIGEPRP